MEDKIQKDTAKPDIEIEQEGNNETKEKTPEQKEISNILIYFIFELF